MDIDSILLTIFIGYIFGCFQTAYFISKIFNKTDIRDIGSGNAGASNITSEMGWTYGFITGFCDILKAYIPTKFIIFILPNTPYELEYMVLAGTAVILGHIYPFFMKFRGGKGIACYLGVLLSININIGLLACGLLIFITIITDYVAIGSILLYITIPIIIYYQDYSFIILGCSLLLLFVGIFKHIINVQRIINGKEKGLKSVIYKFK